MGKSLMRGTTRNLEWPDAGIPAAAVVLPPRTIRSLWKLVEPSRIWLLLSTTSPGRSEAVSPLTLPLELSYSTPLEEEGHG